MNRASQLVGAGQMEVQDSKVRAQDEIQGSEWLLRVVS